MRFSPIMRFSGLAVLALSVAGNAFAAGTNGPVDGEIGLQRSVTPVMDSIVSFNNYWLVPIMVAIVVLVMVLMGYIMFRFSEKRNPVPSTTSHHTGLEVAWTAIPILILMALAVPSMKLLYFQDVIPEAGVFVKATGNTWNWEYSYPDHENVDPYISNIIDIPHTEKKDSNGVALTHEQIIAKLPALDGRPYLFATDAPLVVPVNTTVKVQVTSNNNIHAFSVTQFGVKIDAVPGRLNETWFKVTEEGRFYGQCSEICGVNHAFMPIEVLVVSQEKYDSWIKNDGSFPARYSELTTGSTQTAAMK